MLLEFRVRNFRSIYDEQVLSLVASRDRGHRESLHDGEPRALRVAAIYGANASGKSNLFRAFRSARQFILGSATTINAGDATGVAEPFAFSVNAASEPSQFQFTVDVDGVRFIYGFGATSQIVHSEWLRRQDLAGKGKRATLVYQRDLIADTKYASIPQYDWKFGRELSAQSRLMLKKRTRANGLALSRASEQNERAVMPLFLWFRLRVVCLDMSSSVEQLIASTSRRILENRNLRSDVLAFLHRCDLPVTSLSLHEKPIAEGMDESQRTAFMTFISAISSTAKPSERLPDLELMKEVVVSTQHETPSGALAHFQIADESQGTQRMFALSGPIADAWRRGLFLFVDELDASMHPLLTRRLIEEFLKRSDSSRAQMVFTTHDTSLFRADLFRRDQVYLAETDRSGASTFYSLAEFKTEKGKPRSDEDFEKNYLMGRYGGVPNLP